MKRNDLQFPLHRLQPLLAPATLGDRAALADSIRRYGMLAPLLVADQQIIDGVKRWAVAQELGWEQVPVLQVAGNGWLSRWQANLHRPWTLVETAFGFTALDEEQRKAFCHSLHMPPSPHLFAALAFVARHPDLWPAFLENRLTVPILRDLAHLEAQLETLVPFFLQLEATMAEKRLLAGLIRQCSARGVVPHLAPETTIKDLLRELETVTQPRRIDMQRRFSQEIGELQFPARTEVTCDPSFEKPGVELRVRLKRTELGRLAEIAGKLQELFQRIAEL